MDRFYWYGLIQEAGSKEDLYETVEKMQSDNELLQIEKDLLFANAAMQEYATEVEELKETEGVIQWTN